ncbi:MAG: hypothetical protein GX580_03830 [Candidatus Hydrogenedens sp.]|nr:hypothetical protein [Candidatus Hydrogenedentota bacterium]NLF56749.1 hypothetical protein [Candidatus Hydrogenedens sp.]
MTRYPWMAVGVLACCALFASGGWAQQDALEELWIGAAELPGNPGLRIVSNIPETLPAGEAVVFSFTVLSDQPHDRASLNLQIVDGQGNPAHEARTPAAPLEKGENLFSFSWNAAALPVGPHKALLTLYLSEKKPALSGTVPFDRVSAAWMTAELDRCALGAQKILDGFAVAPGAAYLVARASVMRDTADMAKKVLEKHDWRGAAELTAYVRAGLSALESSAALGGLVPEMQFPAGLNLAHVTQDGVVDSSGLPVCLVGEHIGASTPEALVVELDRVARHGMNLAVVQVDALDAVAAAPFDAQALGAALLPVLDAAESRGVSLVLQLSQRTVAGLIMDKAPDLADAGFPNLAHPALASALFAHAGAVARAAGGHAAVLGLSVAEAPDFMFDGEQVRLGFIEKVRALYPDCQELNRAWRAHLADHDEITIWGDHPEHAYQNRRTYQYEWQGYHRALIGDLLGGMSGTLSAETPNLPLSVSMPANAFEKAETRLRPDREAMAAIFGFQACSGTVRTGTAPYAWDYPRPVSHYTLLRSFAPDKPVLDLAALYDTTGGLTPARRAALVRAALWTSLISGASGIAAAPEKDGAPLPGMAEAFALTALDARRLAPVIRAFQAAPAPVAILYSESSKILDDGDPHLKSVEFAFEGCSFSGYNIRFITERQIAAGGLGDVKVFVMPETPAIPDDAFKSIAAYVENGGTVLRVGTPIPYNERGHSRTGVIRNTAETVLVRGLNMPTEYLHAMDAAIYQGVLPVIPRPVNTHGYPLEGVFTRHVVFEGVPYLYCVNLRKDPVLCGLEGTYFRGRDLVLGRDVQFPRLLEPMDPMLIRLERPATAVGVEPAP